MPEHLDLKTLERRAYLSYHQDGLIDLVSGGTLLLIALMIWLLPDLWFVAVGSIAVITPIYASAKKKITFPRMGYVEFSQVRRQKTQSIIIGFVVMTVVGNILGILALLNPQLGILIFESSFTILLIGLIGGALLAFIGLLSELRRFYLYGIIFLSSAVFTFFFPFIVLLPLIALSSFMILFGAMLLNRFIQRYPKEPSGEAERA